VLLWTHGFWGLLTGSAWGAQEGPAAARRRRARGGAGLAPLAFIGGGLGIRVAAARLLGQALQRRLAKWRQEGRKRRAQKLG